MWGKGLGIGMGVNLKVKVKTRNEMMSACCLFKTGFKTNWIYVEARPDGE